MKLNRAILLGAASFLACLLPFLIQAKVESHLPWNRLLAINGQTLGFLFLAFALWVIYLFAVCWPLAVLASHYGPRWLRRLAAVLIPFLLASLVATVILAVTHRPLTLDSIRRTWPIYAYLTIGLLVFVAGRGWAGLTARWKEID